MIPLKDSPRTRRFPLVNISIILINVIVFLWMVTLNQSDTFNLAATSGLVPVSFSSALAQKSLPAALSPLVTYQFLHGGWFHLIGNMLYLWVFGDNIEDRLGHLFYLLFYLLIGAAAGIIQVLFDPSSSVPIVGASGAVAGVLGAYLLSCPNARVLTIIPIFFFITLAEIRAVFFLLFWFIMQLFNGIATIGLQSVTVAWWAHIGGFVAGMLLIKVFGSKYDCVER